MNRHCCVVEVAGLGILIEGPSGAGKTSLALALLEYATHSGTPSGFICDDQAIISTRDGTLIAHAPDNTSGMVEIRGYGIVPIANQPETRVALVVRLVSDEEVRRMRDDETILISGIELPLLKAPMRYEAGARRIIMAWIAEHSGVTGFPV